MAITSLADLNRVIQEVNRRQEADITAGKPTIPQGLPEKRYTFEEVPRQYEESSPPPLQASPQSPPPAVPSASPQQSNLQQLLSVAKGPATVAVDISGLPGSRDTKLQAVVTPTIDIPKLKSGGVLPDLPPELTGAHIDIGSDLSKATLTSIESIDKVRTSSPTGVFDTVSDLPPELTGAHIDIGTDISKATLHNIATVSGASRSAASIGMLLEKAKGITVDTSAIVASLRAASGDKTPKQKIKLKTMSAPSTASPFIETYEQRRKAAIDALNKYNPQGFKNGDNELIARLAPHLAPGVVAMQYDSHTLAEYLRSYEKALNGDPNAVESASIFRKATGTQGVDAKSFAEASDNIKKARLQELAKEGYQANLPLGVVADVLLSLVHVLPDGASKQSLETYIKNGDLENDMRLDGQFALTYDARKWIGSEEGKFTIGSAFGGLGIVGGFLAGGPVGALAGAGTSVFASTELVNYFGMSDFRDKAAMQKAGVYPPDHVQEYDKYFSTIKDQVDQLWFNKSKMSPEDLKKSYADARAQVDVLGKKLADEWAFLEASKQYDLELKRYKSLLESLNSLGSTFDPVTGAVTSQSEPPAKVTISNIPSGWTVEIGSIKFGSGKDVSASTKEKVSGPLKITDDKGNVYYGSNYTIYPGSSPLVIGDVRDIVAKSSTYGSKSSVEKPPAEITISNVPPGWTASIGSLVFGSGQNIKQTTDKSISGLLKITDDKGNVYYGSNYTIYPGSSPLVIGDVSEIVSKQRQYEKKEETTPDGKVTIFVPAGYTATYMGHKMDGGSGGASYDITGKAGTQISVLYEAPGKRADTLNTMIPQGGGWKAESKYLEPEPTKQKTPSRGIAALNFEPQQVVYLDGQKLDPSKYGLGALLPAGYHTLVVEEEGFRTASKTVYVPAGESVSLSLKGEAVWTSASKSPSYGGSGGGGGGGGYSYSYPKSEYAIVVFGSTVEGATVVLDGATVAPVVGQQYSLAPGYHSVQVSKPGFKTWTRTVYCGSGEPTYISPALEPQSGSSGSVVTGAQATKRLYVNSTPSGAKILIDSRWSGEYSPSYVDLTPGYHLVSFSKSGYSIKSIHVWIGETILSGDAAVAMAEAAGIEVTQ